MDPEFPCKNIEIRNVSDTGGGHYYLAPCKVLVQRDCVGFIMELQESHDMLLREVWQLGKALVAVATKLEALQLAESGDRHQEELEIIRCAAKRVVRYKEAVETLENL